MRNFTVVDTLGILKACLALFPFVFAPGYVAGWALNLFEFRQRRPILRLILAVPLTISICPMFSYLLARFLEPGLWAFYISVFAACALLLAKEARQAKLRSVSKYIWVAVGVMALWVVAAIGSMVDLQIGDKLYPPIVAYDHSLRTALTSAIARHIPPNNPFFANAAVPLRYHYLWLLFCSLPMKVFHLSPRYVVYSGVVWCGLGLMCVVALGLKFLIRVQMDIERKTLLAVGLLSVAGLDIFPTLYLGVAERMWGYMAWWNEVQITPWIDSLLWVPHGLAALIACFIAFLLLRHQANVHRRWATGPVIMAGLTFASAAGMSVYVTFTFVVAVALWLVVLIARKGWREIAMFVSAGVVALLWALPYLAGLRGPGSLGGSGSGAAFVEFALRPFPLGVLLARQFGIKLDTQSELTVAHAIFLPINYGLELGFFLAIGVLRLRQLARGRVEASTDELAAWTLVLTSFLIGSFLRSSTISSNDLGWRCFLPAQLILLLWGTTMVHDWWFHRSSVAAQPALSPCARAALATLLLPGILGTAYEVFMLRMFPVLLDRGTFTGPSWVDRDGQFGKRAYALRSAYEVLDAQLPSSAVLQSNPYTKDSILHMLYSVHDAAAANGECGVAFGGDPGLCALRLPNLGGLFEFPDGSYLDPMCQEYGIDAVVVEDSDLVWREPSSWVWSRPPLVANDYVRAFRCGTPHPP